MSDITQEMIFEDVLQAGEEVKTRLNELYCELAELAVLASDAPGQLAHQLVTSSQEIKTWAKAYELFGSDFIEPEDPLDVRWWRAICATDDPVAWLEEARSRQLSTAQIKNEAGIMRRRQQPLYTGGGTIGTTGDTVYLDSNIAASTNIATGGRVDVRIVGKEDWGDN